MQVDAYLNYPFLLEPWFGRCLPLFRGPLGSSGQEILMIAICAAPVWQSTEGNKQSDKKWEWSLTNSQQGTKSVSPTGCKELKPDNSYAVFKADLSLVELSDEIPALANLDYRLMRDPKAEHSEHSLLNHALSSNPQKLWNNKWLLF